MPSPPGADHYMSLWLLTFGAEENDVLRASLFLQAPPFSVAQGSLQATLTSSGLASLQNASHRGPRTSVHGGRPSDLSLPAVLSCASSVLLSLHVRAQILLLAQPSLSPASPRCSAPPRARGTVRPPTPDSPMPLLWRFSSRPPLQSCHGHSGPPHLPLPPSAAATSPEVLRPPRRMG